MGYNTYIANKKDKTLFNLGKSPLCELSYEPEVLFDRELLEIFVEEEYEDISDKIEYSIGPNSTSTIFNNITESRTSQSYCARLVSDLLDFVKDAHQRDIIFIEDMDMTYFTARCAGYSVTHSIYGAGDIAEAAAKIPTNNVQYNIDLIKKYKLYNELQLFDPDLSAKLRSEDKSIPLPGETWWTPVVNFFKR